MPHEIEVRKEIALSASPEQVWEAIATGPGINSWFLGSSEVDPREGGDVKFTYTDFTGVSRVTAWDPPRRFAHKGDDAPDGTFMAVDYLIEGRGGGSTVLRMVQSAVLGDGWESEYEALDRGWDLYLHTLSEYLTHFPGRSATPITAVGGRSGSQEDTWEVLTNRLGLSATVAEGDKVQLTPEGLEAIDGVVDKVLAPYFLGVRTSDALYRFSGRDGMVGAGHHIFTHIDRTQTEQAWQSWLDRAFA